MALVKSFESESGVTAQEGYHRVQELHYPGRGVLAGSQGIPMGPESEVLIIVNSFFNQQARTDGKVPLRTKEYFMPLDLSATGNIKSLVYDWLKTQADFSGAVDA